VKKFHYLIPLLKDKFKDLISNLQFTIKNLLCLATGNTTIQQKRLIAMMHLCQMSQFQQCDVSPLRKLINHLSYHMNAMQVLSSAIPVEDLMLNHLMSGALDNDTYQQWELNTTSRAKIPTTAKLITF
jgi:hypothetical protein